jgi:hypothetical protein
MCIVLLSLISSDFQTSFFTVYPVPFLWCVCVRACARARAQTARKLFGLSRHRRNVIAHLGMLTGVVCPVYLEQVHASLVRLKDKDCWRRCTLTLAPCMRQLKLYTRRPFDRIHEDLMSFNKTQCRLVIWLLTGHSTVRWHHISLAC